MPKRDLFLDWAPSVLGFAGTLLDLGPIPGLSSVADGLAQICERAKVGLTSQILLCFPILTITCVWGHRIPEQTTRRELIS